MFSSHVLQLLWTIFPTHPWTIIFSFFPYASPALLSDYNSELDFL
jgi:hypothetical protein